MSPAELYELRGLARLDARLRQYAKSVCVGKHRFDTQQQAARTIKHSDSKAFRCDLCGGWHIGQILRGDRLAYLRKRERSAA